MADQLLTPPEVGERLGVAVQTLANWRHTGKGPRFVKVGSLVRYDPAALDKWLANRTMARTPAPARARALSSVRGSTNTERRAS